MNRNRTIVYIGSVLGYSNTAMQIHARNIARIFEEIGYTVVFVSQKGWKPGMPDEIKNDGFHCFYAERKAIPNDRTRKAYRRVNEISGYNLWKTVLRVFKEYPPSIILSYGCVCSRQLVSYSKKNRIPLIFDLTDWFEKEDFDDWYIRNIWVPYVDRCMTGRIFKASGVIVISDYLYNHFRDHVKTIQIPALCNLDEELTAKNQSAKGLRIVYAGSPGKKDVIWPVAKAVRRINIENDSDPVILDLVGINTLQAEQIVTGITENGTGVVCHGKVAHEEAVSIIKNADFSLLLRENRRYARAGFSTKFVESMWLGVPVICTHIGGTDNCIRDMDNGVLIEDNEEETIYKTLKKLLDLNQEEVKSLKSNAYEYARNRFSYKTYVDTMRLFLEEIQDVNNIERYSLL